MSEREREPDTGDPLSLARKAFREAEEFEGDGGDTEALSPLEAAFAAAAPAIEEKARKQERERVLELAEEFEKRAQIEAEKRAKVKKAEATDRASGKLAKGHSYEATWNYHEGLSCAYQRAASDLRTLAALKDSDA